jgi:2-keto-3-deoxy-L-rhamnonate aldolase RhmA
MTPFSHPTARLKTRLKAGEALGCHWLGLGSPSLAELAAEEEPDAIVFDLQHGVWDRTTLDLAVGAIAGRAPVIARTQDQSLFAINSALDAGCHGVIVPLVDTAAECAAVVAAAHYPPKGRRSAGGARSTGSFAAYQAATAAHLLVAVMIETAAGVDASEAIAATAGLDMIFIGPTDLSLALGEVMGSPLFEAAVARILAAGKAAGVPVGIYTGSTQLALQRAAQGFQFMVVANDTHLAKVGAAAAWKTFRAGGK